MKKYNDNLAFGLFFGGGVAIILGLMLALIGVLAKEHTPYIIGFVLALGGYASHKAGHSMVRKDVRDEETKEMCKLPTTPSDESAMLELMRERVLGLELELSERRCEVENLTERNAEFQRHLEVERYKNDALVAAIHDLQEMDRDLAAAKAAALALRVMARIGSGNQFVQGDAEVGELRQAVRDATGPLNPIPVPRPLMGGGEDPQL